MKVKGANFKRTRRVLRSSATIVAVALFVFSPQASSGQAPRAIKVLGGGHEFPTPFSSIRGIRELQDGRVLVIDELEIGVFVLDFRTGKNTPLGREGAGPGEYGWPTRLIDLGGDSTAVMDELHHRMLVIRPDGSLGGLLSHQGRQTNQPLEATAISAISGDNLGRLYGLTTPRRQEDSASVVRWQSSGAQVDTIARIPLQFRNIGNTGLTATVQPYTPEVAWAVGPSGELAVVYPDPYRVEVTGPSGSVKRGPVLAHRPVSLSEAHKQEWLARARKPRIGIMVTGGPAGPVSSAQRVSRPVREPASWPALLPPFLPGAASFSRSGLLWIRRTTLDPATASYDVIDSNGVLVATVSLAPRSEVVGFGRGHVFITRTSEDGLIFLQRFDDPLRSR